MLDTYSTYSPQQFIKENLSLEKQTKEFITFFDELKFDSETNSTGILIPVKISLIKSLHRLRRIIIKIRRKIIAKFK